MDHPDFVPEPCEEGDEECICDPEFYDCPVECDPEFDECPEEEETLF